MLIEIICVESLVMTWCFVLLIESLQFEFPLNKHINLSGNSTAEEKNDNHNNCDQFGKDCIKPFIEFGSKLYFKLTTQPHEQHQLEKIKFP